MDRFTPPSRLKAGAATVAAVLILVCLFILINKTSFALIEEIASPIDSTQPPPLPFEPKMIYLTGGTSSMGCLEQHINCETDERIHKIQISPFFIGTFEVTNREIIPFLNTIGTHKREQDKQPLLEIKSEDQDSHILFKDGYYSVEPGYENYPVIEISWQGASVYAQWLKKTTGKNYRLPTEAEWEYMARAGTSSQYPWGYHRWHGQANCDGCTGVWSDKDQLMPIGSYPPNSWGIYDVLGNVWEWTCSAYDPHYTGDEKRCIDSKEENVNLTLRGSSWFNEPWDTRLSNRAFQQKWHQDYLSGFRLAMSEE